MKNSVQRGYPLPWLTRILFVIVWVLVLAGMGWKLCGGSLYVVSTPSMCPQLCVGSLALDRPLSGEIEKGMTLTFSPPGDSGERYTHTVAHVDTNGTFTTRGVAAFNNDPWTLTKQNVVGQTVASVWGAGWLWMALPYLAVGAFAYVLLRKLVWRSRHEVDILVTTLYVMVPIWRLKPLIRGVMTYSSHPAKGVARYLAVNTGLLPAQFKAGKQLHSFVAPGHRVWLYGSVKVPSIQISQLASFHWWGWVLVYLLVCSPLILYLGRQLFGRGSTNVDPPSHSERKITLEAGGRVHSVSVKGVAAG